MNLIMIVNTELGWDNVVETFDASKVSQEQYDRVEKICKRNEYILIDWRSLSSVESFLRENE